MVSSLALRMEMLHDGVMRRSVARDGVSLVSGCEAVEIITEMSVGVGWNDIFSSLLLPLNEVFGEGVRGMSGIVEDCRQLNDNNMFAENIFCGIA